MSAAAFSEADKAYMQRCFQLARLGLGKVSPNPAVGAVLVHERRIIGEGYHAYYGGPHAEVMAVNSVAAVDRPLIARSTLYVSLEPCCIFGKTPPCTDLIRAHAIPRVVVSQLDFTPEVSGRSVELLRAAGVEVRTGILPAEGALLALPRNVFASLRRPYIVLKYARSSDGYMAPARAGAYWISNDFTRRLTHRWRGQTDAILIGAGTALADDPRLDSRYFPGRSPARVVLEGQRTLPASLRVFAPDQPVWLFSQAGIDRSGRQLPPNVKLCQLNFAAADWPSAMLSELYRHNIGHLTVEGGAKVLSSLLAAGLWDEARIITAAVELGSGLPAPLVSGQRQQTLWLADDRIDYFFRTSLGERQA